MLEQTVTAANPFPNPARGLDCRVYQRLTCELPGFCKPASVHGAEETRWTAVIRDISQGGIRLQLRRRYEVGAALAIEVPASNGHEVYTHFIKVVHVRADKDGMWAHGCQFVSPLSRDELKRLLGPTLNDSFFPEDQPQGLTPTHVARPDSDGAAAAKPSALAEVQFQLDSPQGTVINCRIKSLSFSKSWPLAVGKTITLRAPGENKTPWLVRAKVLQCTRNDSSWLLHCRLVNPSAPADILAALGRTATPPAGPRPIGSPQ